MNANFKINGKEIETKRLILRPFKQQDLEDFYEYAKVDGLQPLLQLKLQQLKCL